MTPWRGMRDHVADDENGGTAVDLFDQIGQFIERADRRLRIGPRHPREHADRRLRRAPRGQQAGAHRRRRGHAHIDDDRHLLVGQRRPVDGLGVPGLVRGQEGDAQRLVAEGERHFELRGGAKPCGNSGHHRIGDAGLAQRFDFLAAAAEHKGIAALEPHRALSRLAPPRSSAC